MEFCDDCGEMMRRDAEASSGTIDVFVCDNCGETSTRDRTSGAMLITEQQQDDVGRGVSTGEFDDLNAGQPVQTDDTLSSDLDNDLFVKDF